MDRRCIPSRHARTAVLVVFGLVPQARASAQDLRLTFAADSAPYQPSAVWYQQQWEADGQRIQLAMEAATGLQFGPLTIRVIVYIGPSYTGVGESLPMHLNVRYPFGMTLVHELGHRLNAQITARPPDLDEHRLLYLYLYDVWTTLYGERFAAAAVEAERAWASQGMTFISKAWDWALAMTREERATVLASLVSPPGVALIP